MDRRATATGARAYLDWIRDSSADGLDLRQRVLGAHSDTELLAVNTAHTLEQGATHEDTLRASIKENDGDFTFPPGSVAGPDAIFIVQPAGPRGFTVAHARFTHY